MPGRRIPLTYRAAGVDRECKDAIIGDVLGGIRSTHREGVLGSGGGFGGLFRLTGYRDPVLVSSIDGVGTKTRVASLAARWRIVGRDVVSHGANDVLCHGAVALFMLDYVASSRLKPEVVTEIITGMIEACREQGIALLGGETAEMPGVYAAREIDVVGCTVGAVERDQVITGTEIRPGDVIVGIASDGLHTNGYSLARAALLPRSAENGSAHRSLGKVSGGLSEPLGDALLRPHRPYARPVLALRRHVDIHGIAHITGGGIPGNLVRILPAGSRACLRRDRWPVPPLFTLIQRRGHVGDDEMFRTFNMGLGLLLVVPERHGRQAVQRLVRSGERAWIVGSVADGPRGVEIGG